MFKWQIVKALCSICIIVAALQSFIAGYFLVEGVAYRDWQQTPVSISSIKWVPYRFGSSKYGVNTQVPELVYQYQLYGKEYGQSTISFRNLFHKMYSFLPFIGQSRAFVHYSDPTHAVVVVAELYVLLTSLVVGLLLVVFGLLCYRKIDRQKKMNIIQHRFRGILKREQRYGVHRTVS